MKKLIISPTYNERENIQKLVEKINALKISEFDILIVDGNSPDKTAEAVLELAKKQPNLYLLKQEKKNGLGSAYLAGFAWALARDYDFVVQMDADLSHRPEFLPEIFKHLEKNDFVVGSRYVLGGKIENWNLFRRFISRLGCFYAKIVLGVPINDLTGGFNGWQTKVLKNIGLEKIKSNGYVFQIELKARALRAGFSFFEAPIIFCERISGKSKISKRILVEAIWRVWALKFLK